jgi:hypothetical protein
MMFDTIVEIVRSTRRKFDEKNMEAKIIIELPYREWQYFLGTIPDVYGRMIPIGSSGPVFLYGAEIREI